MLVKLLYFMNNIVSLKSTLIFLRTFFLHMDVLMLGGHGWQRAVFVQTPKRQNFTQSESNMVLAYAGRPWTDILLHAISAYTPSMAKMATSSIRNDSIQVKLKLTFRLNDNGAHGTPYEQDMW